MEGVSEAICKSRAKKVFVVNLMNRIGQTTGFKVSNYLNEVVKYLKKDVLDYILVNTKQPSEDLIAVYSNEGEIVKNDLEINYFHGMMNEYLEKSMPEQYDVIHLSNILDWLSPKEAQNTLKLVFRALKPDGVVIIRQLKSNINIP